MSVPFGYIVATGTLAAVQLAAAVRLRWAQTRRRPPLPSPPPSAALIVPFHGAGPGVERAARSLLRQRYAGPLTFVFAAAPGDAALPALRALAAEDRRARVVEAVPSGRTSAKAASLLAGLAAAGAPDVLLFADSDQALPEGWAEALLAELQRPGTSAATTPVLYSARGRGPAAWLRLAWIAVGLPWLDLWGVAIGQGYAVRRRDFEAAGGASIWSAVISEDVALSRRLRPLGRIRQVLSAGPVEDEDCGAARLVDQLSRWLWCFKTADPGVWWCGLVVTVVRTAAAAQALLGRGVCWPLLALALLPDAAAAWLALDGWSGAPRRAALWAPLCLPLLWVNQALSAFWAELVWADRTYFADGPRALSGARPAAEARRERALRLFWAAAGGVMLALSYRGYGDGGAWGLLAAPALAALLRACDGAPPRRCLWWGAFFGTVAYAAGMPWLYALARRFLGAGVPEALAWYAGLSAFQGARWGLIAGAAALAGGGWRRAAAFGAAAVAVERFMPTLFPVPIAATQLFHLPTVQCAAALGSCAPALLLMAAAAALDGLRRGAREAGRVAAAFLLLAAANEAWGRRQMDAVADAAARAPRLRVALEQAGSEDHRLSLPDAFTPKPLYAELTRRAPPSAQLVIWPESSYAPRLDYDRERLTGWRAGGAALDEALARAVGPGAPLLLNAVGRGADGALRNVSVLVDAARRPLGVSEKVVLAPFGEYMPFGAAGALLRRVSPMTGHLSPGRPSVLELGPARLGVLICYENFTPGPAAALSRSGANLLVAQVNDSWFDGTPSPEQHLLLGRLRAVETRRAVLHAANTGVSGVVGPDGAVLARLPAGERGTLEAEVPMLSLPSDPSAADLALGLFCALLAAALALSGPPRYTRTP